MDLKKLYRIAAEHRGTGAQYLVLDHLLVETGYGIRQYRHTEEHIAEVLDLSVRCVKTAIKWLEEVVGLQVFRRYKQPNIYRFFIENIQGKKLHPKRSSLREHSKSREEPLRSSSSGTTCQDSPRDAGCSNPPSAVSGTKPRSNDELKEHILSRPNAVGGSDFKDGWAFRRSVEAFFDKLKYPDGEYLDDHWFGVRFTLIRLQAWLSRERIRCRDDADRYQRKSARHQSEYSFAGV